MLKNLSLYGALLLICQLVLSCSPENSTNDAPTEASEQTSETAPVTADKDAGEDTRLVVAFGDSLYAGYQLGAKEGLAPVLERKLRDGGYAVTVRNAGVSGDTTSAGLRRFNFVLDSAQQEIELIVLGLGGNDMLRGIKPEETRANLKAMMEEAKKREIPVILTGMLAAPNLGPDYANEFNAIFPDLAKEYGARLYPFILEGVVTDKTLMLPDNIHPNAKGVEKLVEGLSPLVEEALKQE